jgi:hypothetical protein
MIASQPELPNVQGTHDIRTEALAMGLADTAHDFTRRAKEAREPDERLRLREVASFYARLAGITPDFPSGYESWRRTSRATRYEARAEECRTIADHLTDPKCREQMLALADTYAWMAKAAE